VLDGLDLQAYHLLHASRADFLVRLHRFDEAVTAYDAALALTANEAERLFLEGRRQAATGR
jgi:RNA polymerase sigma-70 factor (ECF subfamily)